MNFMLLGFRSYLKRKPTRWVKKLATFNQKEDHILTTILIPEKILGMQLKYDLLII